MADLKAKHAFGSLANVDTALANGTIDAYDVLFLKDGDTARIGWIDKNGQKVIVEDKNQVVHVEALPVENGDESVVYIFEKKGYIWDAEQNKCVPLAEATDVTELKTKVDTLETTVNTKVDEATVNQKIEEALSSFEVVEF